jgi:hypothetical protein
MQFGSLGCDTLIQSIDKESELSRNNKLYYGEYSIKHKIPEFGRRGYNHHHNSWDWDRSSEFLGIEKPNVTVYKAKEVNKIVYPSNFKSKTEAAWGVSSIRGIMRGQNLKIRKLDPIYDGQKFTCYEIECQGTHCPPEDKSISKDAIIQVCYPSVIVTGLPKSGTSAMYELLKLFPNSIHMNEKENCPGAHRRSHWQFFNSLPRVSDIKPFQDALIVDGCIDLKQNVLMRNILHKPITKYIVMIRNYADMLWSSYNYWCKLGFDDDCDSTHWAKWGHARSPALFNDIIVSDKNGEVLTKNPLYIKRPCAFAGGFYSEYLNNEVWSNNLRVPPILKQDTIVIASEMLEKFPKIVIQKVLYALNIDLSMKFSPSLEQFGLVSLYYFLLYFFLYYKFCLIFNKLLIINL